ncbi:MAG: peptidoglycan-associated lipoprotein Pal [Cyanobacteria bacterium]|nr:peptidoglycan-associated lipoprotein Pal [Cyanobacteriota bacterium]
MSVYQRTAAIAAFSVILGLGVAACGKKAPAVTPPPPVAPANPTAPPAPPAPPSAPTAAPAPRAGMTEDQIFAQASREEVQKNFQDVYFDLDNATIKDAGRASLTANANYMKRWTSVRVTIEGHCDERGTAEYNLALGDRRANAAKAYLVELGVPASSITVVSKGKEAPFCTQSNESCWQENRRGHFVVTAK